MSRESTQTIRRFDRRDGSGPWKHFKEAPADTSVREALRRCADEEMVRRAAAPDRDALERAAGRILRKLDLPSDYAGFAMVMAANAYWAPRLAAVPYNQRLLLLPRCLKYVSGEPHGEACSDITAIRRRAEQLGYRTLIADGTPIVVETLAAEPIEAVVGVACLDSLEAVFDIIWRMGAPAVAVPLLKANCAETSADLHWLAEYVEARDADAPRATGTYLPILQQAGRIFTEPIFGALLAGAEPARHGAALDATGDVARDWLARGGKRLRPFIALAAAGAVSGADAEAISQAALRVALAIEAFHKASLAHDDIEDDDDRRYGRPTLHRAHGQAMAINVGDYLLGLGYQLIAAAAADLPPAAGAAVAARMSRAHVLLAQGQGAELIWRRDGVVAPPTAEALRVYALKTAPAFAAALASGVAMGGQTAPPDRALELFARHIGVGFQVRNDLNGWLDDARAGRATYLTALAAETADESRRADLTALAAKVDKTDDDLARLTEQFEQLGVFDTAEQLVGKLRRRAAELAASMQPPALSDLASFLIQLILT